MKLLIPLEKLDDYGCRDPIPLACDCCGQEFNRPKNMVCRAIKGTKPIKYCSQKCSAQARLKRDKHVTCERCGRLFDRKDRVYAKYCSKSCASTKRVCTTTHKEKTSQALKRYRKSKPVYPRTYIERFQCKICGKPFVYKRGTDKKCCSRECNRQLESQRCKDTVGMCRNNNRHAGWYESPIAGRVWLESSWEVKCAEMLDKHKILWRRPRESFLWIDVIGRPHQYHPDFYLEESGLYLDPKNPHAQERDAYKIKEVRKNHSIRLAILSESDLEENCFLGLVRSGASYPI